MQQMMRFVSGADMVEFQKQESRTYLKIKHLRLLLVIPLRFERKTHALEGRCSIQLSYGTILNCGAKVRFFTNTANFYI